jgi:saccharopine dehydrogenase-like NADP-dependent oxidoreductase
MHHILVAGSGKIGRLIACLLDGANDFKVHLLDLDFNTTEITKLVQYTPGLITVSMDVKNEQEVIQYIQKNKINAVISSLPYFLNIHIANAAVATQIHYFDLTEDTSVSHKIQQIALQSKAAIVPQCGLAPGFVGIVAHHLISEFEDCFQAKLRVGALPQCTSNSLHYSLTWSTDGLINEYGNPCYGLHDGELRIFNPLEGLETIEIQGVSYEAFHTSGGLGSLASLYAGRIQRLSYKTIRYPGHCEKMKFLMDTLKLNEDRSTLKRILERAMPKTYQDMVIIYVSVEGHLNGEFIEKSYVKKMMPVTIRGLAWSAIQICTASSVCAILDLILEHPEKYQGLILQETFSLPDFLKNRFGKYYQEGCL